MINQHRIVRSIWKFTWISGAVLVFFAIMVWEVLYCEKLAREYRMSIVRDTVEALQHGDKP